MQRIKRNFRKRNLMGVKIRLYKYDKKFICLERGDLNFIY